MAARWIVVSGLVLAGITYYAGRTSGFRKATVIQENLQSQQAIKENARKLNKDSARADSASKKAIKADSAYNTARSKIRVVHDTVVTPQGAYVDTTLAQVIHSADSAQAAHQVERQANATLVSSLRVGISLRDERIKLLESRGNPRTSRGIQLGVGYCATQYGNGPCLYVGYGFSVRLP